MDFKFWLLNEEVNPTEGLDEIIRLIKTRYPTVADSLLEKVKQFIQSSGANKIQAVTMSGALGAALYNKILISNYVFSHSLPFIIYVLFHESAHHYQYKRFGFVEMTKYFHKEINTEEAVQFLRRKETVADNLAIIKLKQLKNSGENIDITEIRPLYKGISDNTLKSYINQVRDILKERNEKDPVTISETLYNLINVIE